MSATRLEIQGVRELCEKYGMSVGRSVEMYFEKLEIYEDAEVRRVKNFIAKTCDACAIVSPGSAGLFYLDLCLAKMDEANTTGN